MFKHAHTGAVQKKVYNTVDTNVVTITLNTITNERHVLDYILWSTEDTPAQGESHIIIFDVTANSAIVGWDVVTAGHGDLNFGGQSLECPLNAKITITLTCNTASDSNHLFLLYR